MGKPAIGYLVPWYSRTVVLGTNLRYAAAVNITCSVFIYCCAAVVRSTDKMKEGVAPKGRVAPDRLVRERQQRGGILKIRVLDAT